MLAIPMGALLVAQATPPSPPPAPASAAVADGSASGAAAWAHGDHLTGTWGGARTALAGRGLTLDVVYLADGFAVARGTGAAKDARAYHGNLDATLTLETAPLGLWSGGKLLVYGQNTHGGGVSDELGAVQTASGVESPEPFTQVSEYWFEQVLAGGLVRFKVGRQDANRDFGTPRYAGNFVNSSFGVLPSVPMPSFPAPGLGALVACEPLAWAGVRLAIYDGAPRQSPLGVATALHHEGGAVALGALVLETTAGAQHRPAGSYTLAGWAHTADFDEITADPAPRTLHGSHGFFAVLDQRIFEQPDDLGRSQGLHVFLRGAWAPQDRSAVDRYLGGGVAYHGLLPVRAYDTLGAGFGSVHLRTTAQGDVGSWNETFVETFYKARFTPFFSIEPDVQAFFHPGGVGPSGVVAALRLKVKA